jgi:hypothetical protein
MINEVQLNEMLNQFGSIWPSMGATMSQDQKMGYVVQLATALTENGLDNGESVREGFRKARTEGGQYLPSVPEFVRWCKKPINRPEHALLEYQQSEESTIEQKDEAHKVVSGLKDLLK